MIHCPVNARAQNESAGSFSWDWFRKRSRVSLVPSEARRAPVEIRRIADVYAPFPRPVATEIAIRPGSMTSGQTPGSEFTSERALPFRIIY